MKGYINLVEVCRGNKSGISIYRDDQIQTILSWACNNLVQDTPGLDQAIQSESGEGDTI